MEMSMCSAMKWPVSISHVFLLLLQCVLVCSYTVERYDVVVYRAEDEQHHASYNVTPLQCYYCHNGDRTGCKEMANVSLIPVRNCSARERFCKVRRLEYYGRMLTFDRECAEECDPGCREGAYYEECVTCCNDRNLCNIGGLASSWQPRPGLIALLLFAALTACLRFQTQLHPL